MATFAQWYNHRHRYTSIGLPTSADMHYGLVADKAEQ